MKGYSEDERRALVGAFEASGMSATAFCRQAGITVVTLGHWRERLGRGRPRTSRHVSTPQWVPVVVDGDSGGAPVGGYVLTNGPARMEVPRGFDLREVAALWRMVIEPVAREVRG